MVSKWESQGWVQNARLLTSAFLPAHPHCTPPRHLPASIRAGSLGQGPGRRIGHRHLPARVGVVQTHLNLILNKTDRTKQTNRKKHLREKRQNLDRKVHFRICLQSVKYCLSPEYLSSVPRGDLLWLLFQALLNRDCPLFVTRRVQGACLGKKPT